MGILSNIKDVVKAAPKASVLGTVAVVAMPVIAVTSNIAPMGFDSLGTFFANNAALLGFIAAGLVALGSIAYVVSSNGKRGPGYVVSSNEKRGPGGDGSGAGVNPAEPDPSLSPQSITKSKVGLGLNPEDVDSSSSDQDGEASVQNRKGATDNVTRSDSSELPGGSQGMGSSADGENLRGNITVVLPSQNLEDGERRGLGHFQASQTNSGFGKTFGLEGDSFVNNSSDGGYSSGN